MAEADATSESERERIAFNPSLYVQRDKKILELIKDSTNIIRVGDSNVFISIFIHAQNRFPWRC